MCICVSKSYIYVALLSVINTTTGNRSGTGASQNTSYQILGPDRELILWHDTLTMPFRYGGDNLKYFELKRLIEYFIIVIE